MLSVVNNQVLPGWQRGIIGEDGCCCEMKAYKTANFFSICCDYRTLGVYPPCFRGFMDESTKRKIVNKLVVEFAQVESLSLLLTSDYDNRSVTYDIKSGNSLDLGRL